MNRFITSYAQALFEAGQFNLAVPIIEEALKRNEDERTWDSWIQFLVFLIRCQGPIALSRVPAVRERLDERQIEFIDIITMMLYCSDLNQSSISSENQKSFEQSLDSSSFPMLKTLACLAIRLRWNVSEGWKQVSPLFNKAILNEDIAAYPAGINIDPKIVKEMCVALMLLCQVRFQLSDCNLQERVESLKSPQAKSVIAAEVEALCQRLSFNDAEVMLSSLQQLVIGTSSKTTIPEQLDALVSSKDVQCKAKLWAIQLQLQTNLEKAQNSMSILKNEPGFSPSALSHLLDAVISIKTNAPVHKTKESLLASLKILNGAEGKDDILKLSVMILLASIYQETDFNLAEKMANTAYQYSTNLGNYALALQAGRILSRMFELKGETKQAVLQSQRNTELENRLKAKRAD